MPYLGKGIERSFLIFPLLQLVSTIGYCTINESANKALSIVINNNKMLMSALLNDDVIGTAILGHLGKF